MRSISGKITLIQLVDIFRGSASKKSVKYEHLRLYGSGKSLSRGDAERLAQTMATQRLLEEYCETNGLGFVSSYVRVPPVLRPAHPIASRSDTRRTSWTLARGAFP